MIDVFTRRTRKSLAAAALLAALLPAPVLADTTVLAFSRTQHAKVLAEGSPSWCGPSLHLRLELAPDSPAHGNPAAQSRLLSKLRVPIQTTCPAARDATASVVGDPAASFTARAEDGWSFAASHAVAPPPGNGLQTAAPPAAARAIAPPAPPSTAAAADHAPAPAVPADFVLPRDLNYPSFVVAMTQRNADLANDPQATRYWAGYRFPREFQRVARQEFELQPLLDQARQDLQAAAAAAPRGRVYATLSTQFGTYDFPNHRFPITIGGNRLTFGMQPCCQQGDALPRGIQLDLDGLDAIDGLPMDQAEAQRFAASRSRYGNVDRSVTVLLTIDLDGRGIGAPQYGQSTASGTVVAADVLAGRNLEIVVHRFLPEQMAALRAANAQTKADAERRAKDAQAARDQEAARAQAEQQAQQARAQAEQERQQLLSQRQALTANLAGLQPSSRLRAFMTPGPYADGRRLDNLREARADALITRQPWDVVMLVQADGDGLSKVATTWPGHLAVSAPAGGPPLAASHWYLVAGKLAVPPGDDLPDAELQAGQVVACARDKCGDAAEPDAIVARKLAGLGDKPNPP